MDDSPKKVLAATRPASAVPSGRLNRFLQLGATAGRLAAGGAKEKMRRLAKRAEEELPHALLTVENARILATRLSRLRGAAMKVGQMLSLEGDNMLPKEFAQALEILRSSAHQMPEKQVRQVLQTEYGPGYEERFRSFDWAPLASASIGQVHQAVTHEGDEIVLKIQYPGVAESIESDVDNLRSLLSLSRIVPKTVNLDDFVAEVKNELRKEVDYERERLKLEEYREALGAGSEFRLPASYAEHSTRHILAMEKVPGEPLLDYVRANPDAPRDEISRALLSLFVSELFELGISQTDPNPANYLYDAAQAQVVLLDFGAARSVPPDVGLIYRDALRGLALRDRGLLREVIVNLGVHSDEVPEATEMIVELALEAAEIFQPGVYDFCETDLQARLNAHGKKLMQFHGKLGTPRPEYIFFQRKLAGTYLLCRQLGAKVDVREILIKHGVLES